MKKLFVMFLALALALSVCACGDGAPTEPAQATQQSVEQSVEDTAAPTEAEPAGEVAGTAKFSMFIPAGWLKMEMTDMFAEPDSEGNYPLDEDSFAMIKGGDSDSDGWDAFTKPTVYVYLDSASAADQAEMSLWFYDVTEEIDVTVGETKCVAYHTESEPLVEGGANDVYELVFIPIDEDLCFQINIPVFVSGNEGVHWNDPDVLSMLESLTVK